MKILITNLFLKGYSGTETYVVDLASSLKKRGHQVGVFTFFHKKRVRGLLDQGIEVTSSLNKLSFIPDVIHAHHHVETVLALNHFPKTPAIFISHTPFCRLDRAPKMAQIMRYFGVDQWCRRQTARDLAVAEDEVGFLPNFVNTERFKERSTPLPPSPRRALVFSNYASQKNYLPILERACKAKGISLDVIGAGTTGVCHDPENRLPHYDIVFCKTKAAMEALAVGNCVILCDFYGFGGMVRADNFHYLRENNFGWGILSPPVTEQVLIEEIEKYDPLECRKTSSLIREESSLEGFTEQILELYNEVIGTYIPSESNKPYKLALSMALFRKVKQHPPVEKVYALFANLLKRRLLKIPLKHEKGEVKSASN